MKPNKKYIYLLSLLALSFLVAMCMTIEEIIHPDDPKVDTDIDISVKIKLVPETDGTSKLTFGMLLPKAWNAGSTMTMTLTTTSAYAAHVVTNEPMIKVGPTETNPADGKPWASSFQSKFGVLGNTGAVEWVVFKSATTFAINDKDENQKTLNGTVNIKVHTGTRAVKFFAGYTFCGEAYGTSGQKYPEKPEDAPVRTQVMEVTGGEETMSDFTIEPQLSHVPATFGFRDIFALRYNEKNKLTEEILRDGDVYFYTKVTYLENNIEKVKIIDEISEKTKMEPLGNLGNVTSFEKYIYPIHFFDLPDGVTILQIEAYFTNADKSIVIIDDETKKDFLIVETCE